MDSDGGTLRITDHPILGPMPPAGEVTIYFNGREITAREGETVAAALAAEGISAFRTTVKRKESRGIFCAIGRCTDCAMTVNGIPNIRTCITTVEENMRVESQEGLGEWRINRNGDDTETV